MLADRLVVAALFAGSMVAILVTVGIVLSLVFETFRFLQIVPLSEFLFSLHWSTNGHSHGSSRGQR